MQPKRIPVLCGGRSSEHDVSLESGRLVAENLAKGGYDVAKIMIDRDGQWHWPDAEPIGIGQALARLSDEADCVFIALHGPYGEDGRLQGMFDLADIPYIGSGCAASALALDKVRAKAVARDAGIRVAKDFLVVKECWDSDNAAVLDAIASEIGFPVVAKCATQGSSLGLAMADDVVALAAELPKLLELESVIIEARLKGTEVTCGVLDVASEGPARALPLTEIAPVDAAFFDYKAKYTPGATEEITPARVPDDVAKAVQEIALKAHHAMGCAGLSRSDFIIVDGKPYWLEVNTIPGMTATSLFPQGAAAIGIDYPTLVAKLVEDAIVRRSKTPT